MNDLLRLVSQTAQNINWEGLEQALPFFVKPMSETAQDPRFHGEGDVWTHTRMVCEALVGLDGFRVSSPMQQTALFLAALLHDIGKIPTTRWENGRWASPNHSLVGAKMARQFLWQELGLCGTPRKQQLRETVCNLIRYHSVPPHVIDDPEGKRRLLAIAANGQQCPDFTLQLLCILCEADALGRRCEDQAHMLEQVALCAELAQESGCYHAPYPFPTDHSRVSFLGG